MPWHQSSSPDVQKTANVDSRDVSSPPGWLFSSSTKNNYAKGWGTSKSKASTEEKHQDSSMSTSREESNQGAANNSSSAETQDKHVESSLLTEKNSGGAELASQKHNSLHHSTHARDSDWTTEIYGYYGPQEKDRDVNRGGSSYQSTHRRSRDFSTNTSYTEINSQAAHHSAPPAQYGPGSQLTVIRRGYFRVPNNVPVSCHTRRPLTSPTTMRPEKEVGREYRFYTKVRDDPKLKKPRYTSVNHKDVFSNIGGFLCLWTHLRAVIKPLFQDFICSRRFRLTQDHVNVFINF